MKSRNGVRRYDATHGRALRLNTHGPFQQLGAVSSSDQVNRCAYCWSAQPRVPNNALSLRGIPKAVGSSHRTDRPAYIQHSGNSLTVVSNPSFNRTKFGGPAVGICFAFLISPPATTTMAAEVLFLHRPCFVDGKTTTADLCAIELRDCFLGSGVV